MFVFTYIKDIIILLITRISRIRCFYDYMKPMTFVRPNIFMKLKLNVVGRGCKEVILKSLLTEVKRNFF